MNKREMLHLLIDRLMDIEDSSSKELFFNYMTNIGADFHFSDKEKNRISNRLSVYVGSTWSITDQVARALVEIELIKNLPDHSPEVSVTLTREKALELGLIA